MIVSYKAKKFTPEININVFHKDNYEKDKNMMDYCFQRLGSWNEFYLGHESCMVCSTLKWQFIITICMDYLGWRRRGKIRMERGKPGTGKIT